MKNMIWGTAGLVIAAFALIYMMRLIFLKIKGSLVLGEIVEIREKKNRKGMTTAYIHRLRFDYNGKTFEKDDRAGFNQPFAVGEKKLIRFSSDPAKFEYEDEIKKNIIIAGVLAAVAVVFSVRWLLM